MTDEDFTKIIAKLVVTLASKDDIQNVKKDIQGVKDDVQDLKINIQKLEKKLEKKIDILDQKADTILEHSEAVDDSVSKHDKRLRNIERIPIIANELKRPRF